MLISLNHPFCPNPFHVTAEVLSALQVICKKYPGNYKAQVDYMG